MTEKPIEFTKMHGLGNDFMVIETFNQAVSLSPELIQKWSNRKTGVGFDQLLLLSPHESYDALYSIYNADGSEVEQCGNGARCIAKFLWDRRLVQNPEMTVMTKTRPLFLKYQDDDHIEVDMGSAQRLEDLLSFKFEDETLQGYSVDVGNPHFIVEHELDEAKLQYVGTLLQKQPHFPNGVNVSFVKVHQPNEIEILTFERGVGLTEACGSAATACAFNYLQNSQNTTVIVNMKGGKVLITLVSGKLLQMQGPAREVFSGVIL